MLPTVKYIKLRGVSILKQLELEELLLRCSKDNYLIFNSLMPSKAIVMGFSAKPHELVNIDKVNADNITVLRRYTGGGTVIVDKDTVFTSFIMNEKDVNTKPYPREIMTWTTSIFTPSFNNSLRSDYTGPKFELRENDYVFGDKKIAGNAQTITKDRWVHHTSFLWDFNSENMEYLSIPKKRPDYRKDRKHTDFLTPLHDKLKSVEIFEENLINSFNNQFNIQPIDDIELNILITNLSNEFSTFQPRTKKEIVSHPIEQINQQQTLERTL